MSSGVPARPSGTIGPTMSTPGKSPSASAVPRHRRVDEARRDRVDGDAAAGELDGERLRQADDAALRCRVVRHVRRAGLRARRRDRDDAAPAGGDHVGHGGLHARERAGEVDRDDPVPDLGRDVEQRSRTTRCPALVTRISTGPSSARTRSNAGVDRRPVGDVDLDGDRRAAAGRAARRPPPRPPRRCGRGWRPGGRRRRTAGRRRGRCPTHRR